MLNFDENKNGKIEKGEFVNFMKYAIASKVGGVSELDPEATLVESNKDLLQAMQSAVVQGRQRRPTVEWPTVQAHTETLLTDVYR